jgi:hypothetical protein
METYGLTNSRFDIEYSNIWIRPSQNSLHWLHLRSTLSQALAYNSGFYYSSVAGQKGRQSYLLNVKLYAIGLYATLNGLVIFACLFMLRSHAARMQPNICIFPELTFGGRLGPEVRELLQGFAEVRANAVIETPRDVEIRLAESESYLPLVTIKREEVENEIEGTEDEDEDIHDDLVETRILRCRTRLCKKGNKLLKRGSRFSDLRMLGAETGFRDLPESISPVKKLLIKHNPQ